VPLAHRRGARVLDAGQGAPTQEYREYFEEAQRSQGRRGPAKLVTNFWDGTLARHVADPRMADLHLVAVAAR
jgi:hypothetical protein